MTVKFQPANAKLKRLRELLAIEYGRKPNIYGFSLPAGYSCPFAEGCLRLKDPVPIDAAALPFPLYVEYPR